MDIIRINGYETNIEELRDMAKRWTGSDIAREFEISTSHVYKILRQHGIEKTFIQPKRRPINAK